MTTLSYSALNPDLGRERFPFEVRIFFFLWIILFIAGVADGRTIQGRNFSNRLFPPKADLYIGCNFAQDQPTTHDPPRPKRLWPGDSTTTAVFRRCNLTNAMPPPGSVILEQCQRAVIQHNVETSTTTKTIGGFSRTVKIFGHIKYGYLKSGLVKLWPQNPVFYLSTPRKSYEYRRRIWNWLRRRDELNAELATIETVLEDLADNEP
jgi:hypothetical protein